MRHLATAEALEGPAFEGPAFEGPALGVPGPESPTSEGANGEARPHLVPLPDWPATTDVLGSAGGALRGHVSAPAARPVTSTQLPLEFCLPNGLPAIPQVPESLSASTQPSIVPWAARLAQAVLEVVAAERPVGQLTAWVLPEIYRRLDRRQQVSNRQTKPGQPKERCADLVRSVHVCHPATDVAEISVVTTMTSEERCRALALRLERRRGRWICTELDWA